MSVEHNDDVSTFDYEAGSRDKPSHEPDPGRTEYVPEGMGTITRVAAIIFIIAAVAMWAFLFSPWARDIFQAPDQIADETYVAAIELRCAAALAEMDELPSIRSADSPQERGANVEVANNALLRMRDDLESLPGGTEKDRELTGRWLEDWDIYLADRVTHAEKLKAGEDGRFLNTESDGIFIAERMSGFARVNNFRSCLPPGDL